MNTKAENIRDMFSRIAPRYDLLNRTLSVRIDQLWRKKAVAYLSTTQDLKVLDLCAGTLDLTLEILKRRPGAAVTALDFSEAMLLAGKPKIPASQKDQVTLKVGDAMNLEFPNESYHGVLCGFGIRNVVDNGKAIQEIHRVLKPGGRMIILEFFRPTHWQAKLFHATYGKWVLPRLGSWLSKDPEAYQYLFDSIQNYSTREEFENLTRKNGFRLIASRPLTSHVASIIVGEKS
ncbi:MAG: bifunctional demethylmenaquinone methyltransferase/2-methoxy-6-polyprenyl-1,4-benzoquinol methylase UbiE [bacterium]